MKEVNGIKDIDFAFIIEYVKEQGPDAIQWLKDLKNKPVKPDKNGRERKISFIELRKEFVTERTGKAYPRPPLCPTRRAEPPALCFAGGAEPEPPSTGGGRRPPQVAQAADIP